MRPEGAAGSSGGTPLRTDGAALRRGSVKVTFPDGTAGGERELAALLSGLTPELFRGLFAFGLSELQELRTLQSEEISGYLYGAGLAASGAAIRSAERRFVAELEQLYKPRGRTPLLNRQLQELAAAEQELRRSLAVAQRYDALRDEEERLGQEQAGLESEHAALQRQAEKLRRQWRARPHRLRCLELEAELAALPERDDWPEDALSRWEALRKERDRAHAECARLELQLAELAASLEAAEAEMRQEGDVLAHRAELEHLSDRYAAYEETQRMLVEAETEAAQLVQELRQLLRRIQPDWNEAELERSPSLVLLREQANAFREEWRAWHRQEALVEAEIERLELETAGEPAEEAADAVPNGRSQAPGLSPEEGLQLVRQGRKLYYAWREAAGEAERAQAAAPPRSRSRAAGRTAGARLPLARCSR
ncbi:AAA family ATPase [Paenibacillus sp. P26]|nr:AAA family ATPase [Paenibacillus sp. P26]